MATKIIKSNITISTNNNGNLIEKELDMHYNNKNNNMIISYDKNDIPKYVEIEINDMNNVLKELNLQSNPESLIKRLQNDFISKMRENLNESENSLVSKHLKPKIQLISSATNIPLISSKKTKKNKKNIKQNKNSKNSKKNPKPRPVPKPKKQKNPSKKTTTKKLKPKKVQNPKKKPTKKR